MRNCGGDAADGVPAKEAKCAEAYRAGGALSSRCAFAAEAIKDGEAGYGAAGEQAGGHAEDEGQVVLIEAVDDGDDLQDAEAGEGDE